ncbi:DUF4158 domain-containing protein [Streptomyces sp. NBC_00073]|uniref:DUF4158 domain-containing protein n=1 Tax=unclassified Streptomyces TaxID=2593676 RepID=UPI003868F301
MATRLFADDEPARLRGFPEINKEELIRFFTLAPADVGFIDPGRGRSTKDRLGLAVLFRHDQRRGRHRARQARPGRLPAAAATPTGPALTAPWPPSL